MQEAAVFLLVDQSKASSNTAKKAWVVQTPIPLATYSTLYIISSNIRFYKQANYRLPSFLVIVEQQMKLGKELEEALTFLVASPRVALSSFLAAKKACTNFGTSQ